MRAAVAIVALSLAPALAAPQSLGDAARRQARERSKQAPAPRVYTDADLHGKEESPASAPADLAAPSTRSDAPDETVTPGANEASEDAVRDRLDREAEARKERELTWRRLAREAVARLTTAQRGYDAACGGGGAVLTGG
jgi:hypothetical protein